MQANGNSHDAVGIKHGKVSQHPQRQRNEICNESATSTSQTEDIESPPSLSDAYTSLASDVDGLWSSMAATTTNTSGVAVLEEPPDALTFLRDFVHPSLPCIIRNAMPNKSLLRQEGIVRPLTLTLDDVVELAGGESSITVNVTPDGHGDCVRKVNVDKDKGNVNTQKMFVEPQQCRMTLKQFRNGLRKSAGQTMLMNENHCLGGEPGSEENFSDDSNIHEGLPVYSLQKVKLSVNGDTTDYHETATETEESISPAIGEDAVPRVFYYSQQNDCLRQELPQLLHLFPSTFEFAEKAFGTGGPDAINLWMGNAESVSSMHKDHYENLFYVLKGQKVFLLCPPADVPFLYVKEFPAGRFQYKLCSTPTEKSNCHESRAEEEHEQEGSKYIDATKKAYNWVVTVEEDEDHPDDRIAEQTLVERQLTKVRWIEPDLDKHHHHGGQNDTSQNKHLYPLLRHAHPIWVTVNEGDMLYLPSLWFHKVSQTCETVAINYWYDMSFVGPKWCYFNFLQELAFAATGSQ